MSLFYFRFLQLCLTFWVDGQQTKYVKYHLFAVYLHFVIWLSSKREEDRDRVVVANSWKKSKVFLVLKDTFKFCVEILEQQILSTNCFAIVIVNCC